MHSFHLHLMNPLAQFLLVQLDANQVIIESFDFLVKLLALVFQNVLQRSRDGLLLILGGTLMVLGDQN